MQTSMMFTVEVMLPEGLDPSDLEQEVVTELENTLTGPLDIQGEGDRSDLELDVGAIGSIDDGSIIDDGYSWRRARTSREAGKTLTNAVDHVAQMCLESRGTLESALGLMADQGDVDDLRSILKALDDWHSASFKVLHETGQFDPHT